MPLKFSITDAGFEEEFVKLLGMKRESDADVDAAVADIIADVRNRGDVAVCDYTNRFDRLNIDASGMAVSKAEVDAAIKQIEPDLLKSLELAAERIGSYHAKQMPSRSEERRVGKAGRARCAASHENREKALTSHTAARMLSLARHVA